MQTNLRFFWNGIKAADGKLQNASYSDSELVSYPAGTITIYAKKYWPGFSKEVREAFTVQNDSDGMTDYFETDSIRVIPSHPMYSKVSEAVNDAKAHYAKMADRIGR